MENNMKKSKKVLENQKSHLDLERESHNNIMEETKMMHFWKIKLNKNSKLPIKDVKWHEPKNQHQTINMDRYNSGIPTGAKNNLFVVDIDVKDNGLEEWQQYVETFGEPPTLKISKPSGGYHYYFRYKTDDEERDNIVANITNRSKLRDGKGIDVRTNGGFQYFLME